MHVGLRNAYKITIGKSERNRTLGRRKNGGCRLDYSVIAKTQDSCEHGNEPGFQKKRETSWLAE
jgi:hypothetical protein